MVAGWTTQRDCPDLCACADGGTCYTWKPDISDDQVTLGLVTFCDGESAVNRRDLWFMPTSLAKKVDGRG